MENRNPYQTPSADVATPHHGGYDQSGPFSPSGRFGRLSYIAWNLLMMVPMIVAFLAIFGVSAAANSNSFSPVIVLVYIVILIPMVLFTIRRLHDFDASGWWTLVLFVPLANIILSFMLWLRAGTQGANRFAPPRITRGWETVVGYIGIGFMVLYVIGIVAAIAIPAFVSR
ncbi:MAG TPA: DUF805 domain-containing protein [Gammaproteobacteria bacterium]